jgi:hypothetical protein
VATFRRAPGVSGALISSQHVVPSCQFKRLAEGAWQSRFFSQRMDDPRGPLSSAVTPNGHCTSRPSPASYPHLDHGISAGTLRAYSR